MYTITASRVALAVAAAAALGTLANASVSVIALAHSQRPASTHAKAPGVTAAVPGTRTAGAPAGGVVYLAGVLNGGNEVPVRGAPAVGDPDGQAVEVVRIDGDEVSFAVRWQGIDPPTAARVNAGEAGTNGADQVTLFGTALPDTLDAAVGTVTVSDRNVLDAVRSNPGGFYANLTTAQFPGGAVRGQLHPVNHPVDLTAFVRGGGPLAALLDGTQAVPIDGGPAIGDRDGRATAFVRPRGSTVDFALTWSGMAPPTYAHLHSGGAGVNGPAAVPLFAAPSGLPAAITGVAGTDNAVPETVTRQIAAQPSTFYVNLHNAEFPGGAVRGQLFSAGRGDGDGAAGTVASVTDGVQVYVCTEQADGGFGYTQRDARAKLTGGIRHANVQQDTGPPQWLAPDGSGVTGKVLATWPHGAGNVPELDLAATRTGAPAGLLADVTEILQLNTQGGAAPSGPCDPQRQPIVQLPFHADYLFLTG